MRQALHGITNGHTLKNNRKYREHEKKRGCGKCRNLVLIFTYPNKEKSMKIAERAISIPAMISQKLYIP